MKFLADSMFDRVAKIGRENHDLDIVSVYELSGDHNLPDHQVFALACKNHRLLLTRDYGDYIDEIRAAGQDFPGVIFVAAKLSSSDVMKRLKALIRADSTQRGAVIWL